jgi:hypothetical protein
VPAAAVAQASLREALRPAPAVLPLWSLQVAQVDARVVARESPLFAAAW